MSTETPVTHEYLRLLLDYHYWARDRVLDALTSLPTEQYERDLGSSFPSIRDTLNHVFLAEWIWYRRWQGESPSVVPRDELPDMATLRTKWLENELKVRAYLDSLGEDGLGRMIEYTLISGQAGKSLFWEMLVHVVNHASYHRGQVGTMLRQLGAQPAQSTDMITFYRTRRG